MKTPHCVDGHCVTCADEGVPMRVLDRSHDGIAICEDDQGHRSEVMTALVEPVGAGDRVLVHAGTALVRLPDGAA